MLDINFIRENKEKVKTAVLHKNFDAKLVDEVLELDERRRKLISEIDEFRAKRNKAAEAKNIEEGKKIKLELQKKEPELQKAEDNFRQILLKIPNVYSDDTPVGKDESFNKVIKTWGEPRKFSFKVRDHMEIGLKLGIIDTDKAAKISGARFNYLMGDAARLQFALIQFGIETLTSSKIISELAEKAGVSDKVFVPVIVPDMIKAPIMKKMDRLDPIDDRYYLKDDDLVLIGSAEHTLGPLHMDEVFGVKNLPVRYVGYSTSFRREAGTYGKDMNGIFRRHQFDKLEMESFTTSESGAKEQEFMISIQEYLMQQLELPYHLLICSTGDMGKPDYRHVDLEVWSPVSEKYRETHTSDYMTDYQARRLNTKVKAKNGNEFVCMNDATAFAMGRTIMMILENYQNEDGSVNIPKVLQKWMGKDKITSRA